MLNYDVCLNNVSESLTVQETCHGVLRTASYPSSMVSGLMCVCGRFLCEVLVVVCRKSTDHRKSPSPFSLLYVVNVVQLFQCYSGFLLYRKFCLNSIKKIFLQFDLDSVINVHIWNHGQTSVRINETVGCICCKVFLGRWLV